LRVHGAPPSCQSSKRSNAAFPKKCITNGLNHEWTVGTDFIGPSVFIETKNIEEILKKIQKIL
jgi:hypothetical protein